MHKRSLYYKIKKSHRVSNALESRIQIKKEYVATHTFSFVYSFYDQDPILTNVVVKKDSISSARAAVADYEVLLKYSNQIPGNEYMGGECGGTTVTIREQTKIAKRVAGIRILPTFFYCDKYLRGPS